MSATVRAGAQTPKLYIGNQQISTGGSGVLITKEFTSDGMYYASDYNADGFSSVEISVPPQGVLITKTITANGTYAAINENSDGYSSVTVNVPAKSGYYGTAVPKTIADCQHFEYAEFSTDDYSKTTAFPAMMAAAATKFTFDSVSTPSTQETSLTYGNATARTYLNGSVGAITLTGAGDYFSLNATTPWDAKYIISSKAAMLSAPRGESGSYSEYTAFVFGKMENDVKAAAWSSFYNSRYRQAYSWGKTPSGYQDTMPIGGSSQYDIGLIQSPIEGVYQVVYGSSYMEGFYEIDGAIFYVAAGYAIKDE